MAIIEKACQVQRLGEGPPLTKSGSIASSEMAAVSWDAGSRFPWPSANESAATKTVHAGVLAETGALKGLQAAETLKAIFQGGVKLHADDSAARKLYMLQIRQR